MDRKQHDRKEARTGNMRLASCGVPVVNSSAVFQINFSAGLKVLCFEIPHERKTQNRYRHFKRHNTYMTNKNKLTSFYLIVVLTIYSCGYTDSAENKTSEKATSQTSGKQETEIKPSLNIGGTYSFGDNVEKGPIGSVIVYPLTDNTALFFLDVCRGAPSYNLGQMFGQMTIKNNIGVYDSKLDDDDLNCLMKFEFNSDQLIVTTGDGRDDCGFGHAVHADNTYKLVNKSIPKYFINGEGDTIQFKGLTVEKYAHRFDEGQ